MTDDTQWQSPEGRPGGTNGAGTPGIPPILPVPAPASGYYTPPGQGSRPQSAQGQPGWTPPPKPGLIPLRPLDLGTILGASFRVLRRNPRPTFGAALLLQGSAYLLLYAVVGLVTFFSVSRINSSTNADNATIAAGSVATIVLASLVPVLLSAVVGALVQGIIVLEISRATLGEKQTFRELYGRARGRIGALIGWTLIVGAVLLVAFGVLAGLVALFVATLGVAGIVIGVLLGVFGGLGFLVVAAWITTKLSLVPSVLMIERLSIRQAVARSWKLTRGSFWRVFGIQLLVSVIISVISQVVSAPLGFIAPIAIGLLDPNGQQGAVTVVVTGALLVLTVIVTVVFLAISTVVQTATTALLYVDLRMRREGLDLELVRFVEARQSGAAGVADPYLPREAGVPAPAGDSPWA
ncbi:glycerophosphoryl diester phosphodiesterase membrane domain-containing protein [Lacisediminihabitans sp.]|uniref:glycerophosphoryl diester phosphodiesterase membrane domain-containing protein n=1 Tax=Lacisediminihabitans sp. TaxID=2787631 RepID=UPI00374D2809